MKRGVVAIMVLVALAANAAQPQLDCSRGPVERSFGGSQWLVYACDDGHSVVVVSAPGSAAMPFYFIFAYASGAYRLSGEGTGDKTVTDLAYKQLSALKGPDIQNLFDAAVGAPK